MAKKIDLLILPSVGGIEEMSKGIANHIHLTQGTYANLEFHFTQNSVSVLYKGKDLKEFSTVWILSQWELRDAAYAVKLYLDHFKISHTFVEKGTSKLTDQIKFAFGNIAVPDTFFISQQSLNISDYVESIEKICGYPLIIKDSKGSRGKNSEFITNRKELLDIAAKLPKNRKYLFQRFIPNDYDWGILVAYGKVVSAERSYPMAKEFRNNACNGAKEHFVNINTVPAAIKKMAINASKVLGLSWSRSDIIVDKYTNAPYLLEVNRYPGITPGTSEVIGAQDFLKSHLITLVN